MSQYSFSPDNTPAAALAGNAATGSLSDRFIAWCQQPRVWGFVLSMFIMAAVSLAFFYPDNFEGNSLQQPDMVQGAANGEEGRAFEEATGEKALWTNSLFGGMPTTQISPSYPSNSLFDWINTVYGLGLPAPSNLLMMMMTGFLLMLYCMNLRWYYALMGALAWGLSSYFVIIIGAGHIWKFVALSYIPPTIGGLVLCYRGRYVVGSAMTALFAMLQLNANHPQMTYYFGLVMAAMVIAYLCDAFRSGTLRNWCVATGCVLGAGLLGVGANLPALYNTYEYAKETDRAPSELTIAQPAADDAAADAPAAKAPTGGMDYNQIVNWSYTPDETVSLLIPNIKGGASAHPVAGQNHMMALSQLPGAATQVHPADAQLLDYFPQYFNDTEGTNGPVYVGALICVLFLLGCFIVKGPLKWAMVVMTLVSVLLAWGRHFEWLTDLMIYHFPMYNRFRAVESILVIAEFTMPLMAVLGLQQWLSDTSDSEAGAFRRYRWQFLVAVGVPVALCLLAIVAPGLFGADLTSGEKEMLLSANSQGYISDYASLTEGIRQLRRGLVTADAWRSLGFIAFGAVILWLAGMGRVKGGVGAAGIIALIVADLYNVDHRYVDSDNFIKVAVDTTDPLAADAIDKAILADKDLSYRVADVAAPGDPRRSFYHKMIAGYHAAKLRRYNDLLTHGMLYTPAVLDMLNTRYIIGAVADPSTGERTLTYERNPYALGNAWFVSKLDYVDGANAEFQALTSLDPSVEAVADNRFRETLGSAQTASGTITLTGYTPNRLDYRTDSPTGGVAVFSEVYFPWGWHATIDGKPAELGRVNYILRALRIPAGQHTVAMVFDPQSLHTTGSVAYACVTLIYLLLGAGLFMAVRRNRLF